MHEYGQEFSEIFEAVSAYIQNHVEASDPASEEQNNRLRNRLFDLDGPQHYDGPDTPEKIFVGELIQGFFEISDAFEGLCDAGFYLRRFPFGGTRISKGRHLRLMVGFYLEQIYIFRERLRVYCDFLRKSDRDDPQGPLVSEATSIASSMVEEVLGPLLSVRGRHVHLSRYTDSDLERLQSWELFKITNPFNAEFWFDYFYKSTRKKWVGLQKKMKNQLSS